MGEYMANLRIVRAKLGFEVCAGQSSDCSDPNFAHGIYIGSHPTSSQFEQLMKVLLLSMACWSSVSVDFGKAKWSFVSMIDRLLRCKCFDLELFPAFDFSASTFAKLKAVFCLW